MKTENVEHFVGVYKPNKSSNSWRYFVYRKRPQPGTFAIREYLTPAGTWSEFSFNLKYFHTEKEAKAAINNL